MVVDETCPQHIGYIMDGNGRWAKSQGKPRSYGHEIGAKNVENVIRETFKRGVKIVSLYAFSTENWKRPKEEIDKILSLLEVFALRYEGVLKENEIRLMISGDIEELPTSLKNVCLKVQEETRRFDKNIINIAINYGGRQEIINACKRLVINGKTDISEEDFKKCLYTGELPDIDLIVRTSGEQRLSNFFLFQSAYAELYFTDKAWPEFGVEEIDRVLEWYKQRKRRFGGI